MEVRDGLRRAVIASTAFVVIVCLAALLCSCCERAKVKELPHSTLDYIEYESPFTGTVAYPSMLYLVADRESGDEWWLMRVSDKWVVLPRGVSKQEVPR